MSMLDVVTESAAKVSEAKIEITPETNFFDDLHFDSTSILELMMEIEDRTGKIIDPENIDPEEVQTIGAFASYMEKNGYNHD